MTRILLSALVVLFFGSPAQALDSDDPVSAGDDNFNVEVEHTEIGTTDETPTTVGAVDPPRNSHLDSNCVRTALSVGEDPFTFCSPPTEEVDEPVVTPDLVATAFRQIPLPASELQVQPANGRTLVNFATNFFTDTGPFDRTVLLLGQRVDLRIVPSEFGWRFGDGASLASEDAGSPYPDLQITHEYQRKGRVLPAVDTTYTATYRVNGGAWAPVPGSVTISGESVGLEVLTATPELVGS